MTKLNLAEKILFILILAIFIGYLTACSSLSSIGDVLTGQTRQKPTGSLYKYRADLQIKVDGVRFDGVGVTISQNPTVLDITSQVSLDRVEVETCARLDVCQNGKDCLSTFNIDSGWWGSAGNHMTYTYIPSAVERGESCPMRIKAYDKSSLAAWGGIVFRNGETLPAVFTCNGVDIPFAGHSVCQTKSSLIQRITFAVPIEDFDADAECNIKKINDKSFEIRPSSGLCTGKFYAGGKWHGMDVVGYDEVLIRGE